MTEVYRKLKDGLPIVPVENEQEGTLVARDLLYAACNEETLLFLSGGSTPRSLYEMLAKEKKLRVGALAIIDERFGNPMHENSNERMIDQTGLLAYFTEQNIPFYRILKEGASREQASKDYNTVLSELLPKFKKKIAIVGIGEDGHTLGIAPNREFDSPDLLVDSFDDQGGPFGQRITTTFKTLSQMDVIMALVFGEKKKKALKALFMQGSLIEIPARFYTQPDIAPKTLFITDQKV